MGESQPAVLLRDLDGHALEVAEALDDRFGNLVVPIDRVGIHVGLQERRELVHPGLGAIQLLLRDLWEGVNQLEVQPAVEKLLHETGSGPLRLACGLYDATRLALADVLVGRGSGLILLVGDGSHETSRWTWTYRAVGSPIRPSLPL